MNVTRFFEAPIVIQVHAAAALLAFLIAVALLTAPKGTVPHRAGGVVFLGLMAVTALTAVFIREINSGGFSLIHLFVPLTLWAIVGGYLHARRGERVKHRDAMLGLVFGALLIPGALAFAPGRLMHEVILG